MKQIRFLTVMTCCLFLYSFVNAKEKNSETKLQGLPVIDLTKNYPEKEFVADDVDKEYIPLETTKEVLAEAAFRIDYVSDKRIVGTNLTRGDVFIFGRDGKIISYFNKKGQSGMEYLSIMSLVFDEKNQEIFIADYLSKNQCLVYSTNGKFLRKFNFPDGSWVVDICNFNDETLLVYNGHRQDWNDKGNINQIKPYVFLSKKDGSVVSRLDLSFPKRMSDKYNLKIDDKNVRQIAIGMTHNAKFGQEFVIADRSCDTVFLLKQDKKLTPLFVRTPSCFNENKLVTMGIDFKTDKFLFFGALTYNWSEIIAQEKRGQQVSLPPAKDFAYNLQTGEIFTVTRGPSGIGDAPKNTAVRGIRADRLVKDLKDGKLKGKLEQVAKSVNEDDNPVIEITKFR